MLEGLFAVQFERQDAPELTEGEREKTEEEIRLINIINEATNEILESFGVKPLNLETKHIHIIQEKNWYETGSWEEGREGGRYYPEYQGIRLLEQKNELVLASNLFHEMMHAKSFQFYRAAVTEGELVLFQNIGLDRWRSSDKRHIFHNLDEAAIEELAKQFFLKTDDPLLTSLRQETNATLDKVSISPEERTNILSARITGQKTLPDGRIRFSLTVENFAYSEQRNILNSLIGKLWHHYPDTYSHREDIFNLFTRAQVTGSFAPLGRLIDDAFGRGTFKKLAELDEKLYEGLDALKTFVEGLPER